jgi:hypothetical protein
MVRDPKDLFQNHSDPPDCPAIIPEAEGCGSASDQRRDLGELLVRQERRATGSGMMT